ncbi:hypothetical protein CLOBOL_01888 [Enterocloster bolteae ATCC BAA-613]|uniref:Uncharacterized protein n=1 Tax=Enterocloster bolteae (strain ATCC BAA-613 / DSM 15670 / CCUG 46953 / JCM 12243 / WAL 16351) TaxID=411902 RepID=A8RMF0_ENTBW|nr:hypothetical protein CLOBOL_01888 [Enterocloster bolteae ATCC BAA-613]
MAAYQRLTNTSPEPRQGCPDMCYSIKKDGKWRRTPR